MKTIKKTPVEPKGSITLKSLKDSDYIVVPSSKRTIKVNFTDLESKRFFIQMPKIVFVKKANFVSAYALNEKDELCHMPFLNMSMEGEICISEEYGGILTNPNFKLCVESWKNAFFSTPFQLCYDTYADSLNLYFLHKLIDKRNLQRGVLQKSNLFKSGYKKSLGSDNEIEVYKDQINYRRNYAKEEEYRKKMITNVANFYENKFSKLKLIPIKHF